MSLDISLYGPTETVECVCSCCEHVHTRQSRECYFDANITHNLTRMADAAGIYKHLWRPEEIGITKASQLIEPLRIGLELLQSDRKVFEIFNPENGWGSYDGLVKFVSNYLEACESYPEAEVYASR